MDPEFAKAFFSFSAVSSTSYFRFTSSLQKPDFFSLHSYKGIGAHLMKKSAKRKSGYNELEGVASMEEFKLELDD
jgi:hypothetical protein